MAAGYPLPKRIFAHGWLLFENDKMSKSRGNIVRATPIVDVMGIDALRYYLLRETSFGKDGSFSYDALVGRYNSDLANGLGNLVSRTLTMINQYRDGYIPAKTDVSLPRRSGACSSSTMSSTSRERSKRSGRRSPGSMDYRAAAALEARQEPGRRRAGSTGRRAVYGRRVHSRDHCAGCSRSARDGGQDLAHARDARSGR